MFTIKYIYPTGQEFISGPYEVVTSDWVDDSGNSVCSGIPSVAPTLHHRVVYGFRTRPEGILSECPSGFGADFTCGPNIPHTDAPGPVGPSRS